MVQFSFNLLYHSFRYSKYKYNMKYSRSTVKKPMYMATILWTCSHKSYYITSRIYPGTCYQYNECEFTFSCVLMSPLTVVLRWPFHITNKRRIFKFYITLVIMGFLTLKDVDKERKGRLLVVSIPSACLTWGNVKHSSLEQTHESNYRHSIEQELCM